MTDLDIFPSSSGKPILGQDLYLTLILFLIISVSFEILNEIFDHRDNNDQEQRYEDGRFAFWERDSRDGLQNTYEEEIN